MTLKKTYLDNLPKWHWALPFEKEEFINDYLNKKIGINEHHSQKERSDFVDDLYKSLSLSKDEKNRVFSHYKKLSLFQLQQFSMVFDNERDSFIELEEKHPDDIDKLFYKNLLEWGLFTNELHGDIAFIEKFLSKKFNQGDYSEALLPVVRILFENKKYDSLVFLIKKIMNESTEIKMLFELCKIYVQTIAISKKEENIDFDSLNISKKEKCYLHAVFIIHLAQYQGFSVITTNDFAYLLRNYRFIGGNDFILRNIVVYYFSIGSKYKYLKAYLRYVKSILKDNKITIDSIENFYSDLDEKKQSFFISIISNLILVMALSYNNFFQNELTIMASWIYEKMQDKRFNYLVDHVDSIIFLELILDVEKLSSKKIFEEILLDEKHLDIKYLFSIKNKYFNSIESILENSKRILDTYNKYSELYYYVSIVAIFLLKKSPDNNRNYYILSELCIFCREKGFFVGNEIDIYMEMFSSKENKENTLELKKLKDFYF